MDLLWRWKDLILRPSESPAVRRSGSPSQCSLPSGSSVSFPTCFEPTCFESSLENAELLAPGKRTAHLIRHSNQFACGLVGLKVFGGFAHNNSVNIVPIRS